MKLSNIDIGEAIQSARDLLSKEIGISIALKEAIEAILLLIPVLPQGKRFISKNSSTPPSDDKKRKRGTTTKKQHASPAIQKVGGCAGHAGHQP